MTSEDFEYPSSITTDTYGRITSITQGTAPVTSITAGNGISVTSSTTPEISLATIDGVVGTYSYPRVTVDNTGRITTITGGIPTAVLSYNFIPYFQGFGSGVITDSTETNVTFKNVNILSDVESYGVLCELNDSTSSIVIALPTSITPGIFRLRYTAHYKNGSAIMNVSTTMTNSSTGTSSDVSRDIVSLASFRGTKPTRQEREVVFSTASGISNITSLKFFVTDPGSCMIGPFISMWRI